MPTRCRVYGCHSNYDNEKDRVTTLFLPNDPEARQHWIRKIPADFLKLKRPAVCIKHFEESIIIRSDTVCYKDELKEYPRQRPKFRDGAVPSIFPNTPSYLSQPASTVTRLADVEESRFQEAVKNSLLEHAAYISKNKVSSLEDIITFLTLDN